MEPEFNIDNEFANYNWLGTKSNANAYVGMPSWGDTPAHRATGATSMPQSLEFPQIPDCA